MRLDEPRPVEAVGGVARDDLAVAHHDDAVAGREHLVEEVRDQDAAQARVDAAPDEGEELARGMRVERRGRLVEDDEPERRVGQR